MKMKEKPENNSGKEVLGCIPLIQVEKCPEDPPFAQS